MSALSYFGIPLATLLVTTAVAWRIGDWTIARVRSLSPLERAIIGTAIGFAEIGYATFALGLCHLLRKPVLLGFALGVLAVAAPGAWRGWRALFAGPRPSRRSLLIGAVGGLAGAALLAFVGRFALYPATGFDATMYHLPLAKGYVAHHAIGPALSLRYPVMVQLNEAIFAAVFGFGGELAAQGVQLVLLALTAGAIFVWGRRWFSAQAGLVGAAAFLGSPLVVFLGTTGYIDISVALYTTAGCFVLSRWVDEQERGCLWLGGALLACAATCKYLGLVSLAIGGIWIAIEGFRRRQWRAPFEAGLAALLVALPFYVYVTYHTRNPVFPFYSQWFGYSYWTPAEARMQLADMQYWGGDKSLTSFLCVLRNMAEMRNRFHAEAVVSTAYFFGWPFAFLAAVFHRRARTLFLMTLAALLYWFFQFQIARYFTPFLPLLCLACAGSVLWLLAQVPRSRGALASWPPAIALALLALWPTLDWGVSERRYRGPIPTNVVQRGTYLRTFIPGYSLVEQLNRGGTPYRVHGVLAEELAYYFDGEYFGDHFGPYRYQPIFDCPDGHCLARYLESLRIDYLIALKERVRTHEVFRSSSFILRFRLAGEDRLHALYRLTPARGAARPAP